MSSQVDQFVDLLKEYRANGSVSNPWADWDHDYDIDEHAPHHRSNHLRAYLNARLNTAKALLIAEAPGYQGAKFSGIPMTCERTLLGHRRGISCADVLDATIKPQRTSRPPEASSKKVRLLGFCEPTAAYVWGHMANRPGLSKKIVLWNLFAFHPYKGGDKLTNRKPKGPEILSNRPVLDEFLRLFPDRPILSVGNISEEYLTRWGHRYELFTRHPANGGGAVFREKFAEFLNAIGLLS
jgi:hypothetical protein